MLKEHQEKLLRFKQKVVKLLDYAAELEGMIDQPVVQCCTKEKVTVLRWHLYFRGRSLEHEALKLLADALFSISKKNPDLATTMVRVTVVT